MDIQKASQHIQDRLQGVLAVYVFGSHASGDSTADSDLDLAVLLPGTADPLLIWRLSGELADIVGVPVDLIDLRAASTVMQYQIVTKGQRRWAHALDAGLFEAFVLSEKTALDTARAGVLVDIQKQGSFMADDVLINKAASIERCVVRARQEYQKDASTFATDFTRQDAAILNIQRACEAALDMGQHLIRREKLGVPQSARDVFELLCRGGWLETSLLTTMKNMVGFRNIAVREYQTLQLPITVAIITEHLDDFIKFSSAIIRKDAGVSGS